MQNFIKVIDIFKYQALLKKFLEPKYSLNF